MTPPESDTPRVEPDWMAIQKAVDDDCPMSIVKQLALNEASWEEAADRIEAYAQAAWTVAIERELAARKGYVLVPVEPTEAIIDALEWEPRTVIKDEPWQGYQRRAWAAILVAAAPGATNEEGK